MDDQLNKAVTEIMISQKKTEKVRERGPRTTIWNTNFIRVKTEISTKNTARVNSVLNG